MNRRRKLEEDMWEGVGGMKKKDKVLMDDAKVRARGDLDISEWMKQGHAWRGELEEPTPLGKIVRVHVREFPVATFISRFEIPNLPVLIDGLAESWPAWQGSWEPRNLNTAYRHRRFRCGEDDKSRPVKVPLKLFLRYMRSQRDDSPLYVFDSMYNDHKTPSQLLSEYTVPPHFSEDLLSLVGEHRRPPYRWMLLGPKRSGTCVHIDPLATSAWNTLLYGRKRWVLFEPNLTRAEVKGKELVHKEAGEDDEAIDYFHNVLPRLKARGGEGLTSRMLEFTQYPGETIFVPGGWWHAVLNLDDTVAVTQNYCSSVNFDKVWGEASMGRRGMARKWLRELRSARPDLAARADSINSVSGWNSIALASAHRRRKADKYIERERRRKQKSEERAGRENRGAGCDSDESDSDSDSCGTSSSGSETSLSSLSSVELKAREASAEIRKIRKIL